MITLDWQQKAAAFAALAPLSVKMRKVGDWYVEQRIEIKDSGVLVGTYGNGADPEEAIVDHWERLVTDIADTEKYLVVRAYQDTRQAVKWNGFMWAAVSEPTT